MTVTRAALLCFAIGAALPQSTPDFSGKWKLNLAESEFAPGTRAAPNSNVVRTVEQKRGELRLKIERVINGEKGGFNFVTIPIDTGTPHVSNEAGIITATWKNETLHFDYLYNPDNERRSERTEDWTLSADGKKLIDREWSRRPDGQETRYTLVFDKQP